MGLTRNRANRPVRQDVVTEPGVPLDPLGVQEDAGGNSDRRIQRILEKAASRPVRDPADPWQCRRVTVVPRVGPVKTIGGLGNS